MSTLEKLPLAPEYLDTPLETKIEEKVVGDAENHWSDYEVPEAHQFPEASGEVDASSTPEESPEDVPSRFGPRAVIAGLRRWLTQRRIAKSKATGPFGPANNELIGENGELLETSLPEGTLAERHPDWPTLKVNLFLSRHETAEDYRGVQERLAKKPDILLYEGANGDDYKDGKSGYTRWLEAISEGALRVMHPQGREGVLLKSVQGSGTTIGSIDTTKDERDAIRVQELFDTPMTTVENYDATLDIIKDHNAKLAEAQNKRDAIMVKRFEHEIGRILEQNPGLREKSELHILIPLGGYHTRVGHGLRRMGVETNVEFEGIDYEQPGDDHSGLNAGRSYVYDYPNRLQRTMAFGREPSRELVERTYASYMLGPVLQSPGETERSKDFTDYRDSIVGALESEDIQAMHEIYLKDASPSDIRAIVEHRLAAKGLPPLVAAPRDIYLARDVPKAA